MPDATSTPTALRPGRGGGRAHRAGLRLAWRCSPRRWWPAVVGEDTGPCTERSLARLESVIAPRLAAHPALAGHGVRRRAGRRRRARTASCSGGSARVRTWPASASTSTRSSIDVYDYLQMEWFQEAQAGGPRATRSARTSTTRARASTSSPPPSRSSSTGTFLGVAGADIVMAHLERRLIAVLRTCATEAVVVNPERRVLAANTARWVVGARLPRLPSVGDGGVRRGGRGARRSRLAGRGLGPARRLLSPAPPLGGLRSSPLLTGIL